MGNIVISEDFPVSVRNQMAESAVTIRGTNFIKTAWQDTFYRKSFNQKFRCAFLIDGEGLAVGFAILKVSTTARTGWGRYGTLTFVYVHPDWRGEGQGARLTDSATHESGVDRIKGFCLSRSGLHLQIELENNLWGLGKQGRPVFDSPLGALDPDGIPPFAREQGCVSLTDPTDTARLFSLRNWNNYLWRGDPEEALLYNMFGEDHGYFIEPAETLYGICRQEKKDLLRWENRKGTYIKKPSLEELRTLTCFHDKRAPSPWYYAGEIGGPLRYRVTVSKIGEHRPAQDNNEFKIGSE